MKILRAGRPANHSLPGVPNSNMSGNEFVIEIKDNVRFSVDFFENNEDKYDRNFRPIAVDNEAISKFQIMKNAPNAAPVRAKLQKPTSPRYSGVSMR